MQRSVRCGVRREIGCVYDALAETRMVRWRTATIYLPSPTTSGLPA